MKWKVKQCVLCMAVVCAFCLTGCEQADEPKATDVPTILSTVPQQQEYGCTWEEFENMTAEEQIAFQNSFPNEAAFDAWFQSVQIIRPEMPWDNNSKQPDDYTWEEFEALTAEQQIAFQNSFEDWKGFEQWMDRAQYVELVLPWDNGGKQPEEYTWEEFEALSVELQMAFQESFDSFEAFDSWMQCVAPEEDVFSWEDDGKALEEYTWEEFENMTPEEQMAFQNAFESFETFDEWLVNAQFVDEQDPWETGEKNPAEYTWEEFEALSGEEQIRFQNSFESQEEFEKWLFKNMPED